jgi:hypothetical protein
MKRDMDLIRLLLLDIEGDEKTDLSGFSKEQLNYHKALLIEAGLVQGAIANDGGGNIAAVKTIRLTWDGHEFLSAARNNSIWNKAKEAISKANLAITVPILKELLTILVKEQLGIK